MTLGLLSVTAGCTKGNLSRETAAELIRGNDKERYDTICKVDYWKGEETQSEWGVGFAELGTQLGAQLGEAICSCSIEVTGIALTSESTRDVVFHEKFVYDPSKAIALAAYVEKLAAHLVALPVQATRRDGGGYEVVVIEPTNGRKFLVSSSSHYSGYNQEAAIKIAKTSKLTPGDVWNSIPMFLARHKGSAKPPMNWAIQRTARLQLFDDGWRVLSVSPPSD
jgi:hypothetical protein